MSRGTCRCEVGHIEAKESAEPMTRRSFDHLAGAPDRHIEAERLHGLEANHHFVLGRSLHRQVGRPPEDAIDIAGRAAVLSPEARKCDLL
jgi:hypothetical protein